MIRVGLVALLVALAGCPALGGGSDVGPTATPAPVPDTTPYPDGVGPWGVDDPTALADAHSAVVDEASYTLVSNRTITAANGSLRSLLFVQVRLSADRAYHATVRTAGPAAPELLGTPPARGEYWSDGSVYVRALTRDGRTTYNQFTPPDRFSGTWRYWRSTAAFGGAGGFDYETFESLFADVRTELEGTSTTDGQRLFHVSGASVRDADFAKVGTGPVRNLTFAATVTESGLIRNFTLAYDRRIADAPVHVDWTLAYENVSATAVDRPRWYDRAVDDGAQSS